MWTKGGREDDITVVVGRVRAAGTGPGRVSAAAVTPLDRADGPQEP
jgi:hypothetical protein